MPHRAVLFLLLFLLTATAAISQQIIVSGKVIDSSGTAMEGVSVKLRHDKDSTGVITGKNGLFSLLLTIDKALTLQVSA